MTLSSRPIIFSRWWPDFQLPSLGTPTVQEAGESWRAAGWRDALSRPLSGSRSCDLFAVLDDQWLASPPVLELAWSAGIVALAVQMPQALHLMATRPLFLA